MASYTLRDVLWAINVVNKYSTVKETIDSLIRQLATKGVRVSEYDLQNPTSLLPIFIEAKKMGIDIDLSEVEKALDEVEDLTFDDVEKALQILSEYDYLNNEVDRTFRSIMDNTGMSMKQLGFIASMFGFNIGLPTAQTNNNYSIEELADPEDYEKLKSFIRQLKKSKT